MKSYFRHWDSTTTTKNIVKRGAESHIRQDEPIAVRSNSRQKSLEQNSVVSEVAGAMHKNGKTDVPSCIQKSRDTRGRAIGFKPRSETLHRVYNASVAGLLLFMVLPLLVLISLALLVTQSRPIFYRGTRVGRNGTLFDIYKFRTLDTAKATQLTKDKVLPAGSGLETPLGGFLRETRLDELPQLLNVLKGEMNICGPRPLRPEIAGLLSSKVRGISTRLSVKPGLLGPTQALMSHGTSKTVRGRLNAAMCAKPVSYRSEIEMIVLVGACVMARSVSKLASRLSRRKAADGTSGYTRDRAAKADVAVMYRCAQSMVYPVLRIDDKCLILPDTCAEGAGKLVIALPDGTRRVARITSENQDTLAPGQVVMRYRPGSDYSQHILERYLMQSVVVPHRSHFLFRNVARAVKGRFRPIAQAADHPASSAVQVKG
ncbi:sugar transferase [Ruegeria atlantica]|uniref:Putative undecaprenyl-phosphate N-acetylgalactosaminyl 1-phosphate transferase n=1 Tax=Ruegeria atlantica TaxID=81569 RepID=A0A0P1E4V7_9RHOB|nr:sugar transferase [Ruegeria atlantica]CUH42208.1 Putative undecaprenyl-phosphate N-acetylgalactosaminyl 1-phosphate transferase [Ruegeria atlantica]